MRYFAHLEILTSPGWGMANKSNWTDATDTNAIECHLRRQLGPTKEEVLMDKKKLSESDICGKFVFPATKEPLVNSD